MKKSALSQNGTRSGPFNDHQTWYCGKEPSITLGHVLVDSMANQLIWHIDRGNLSIEAINASFKEHGGDISDL